METGLAGRTVAETTGKIMEKKYYSYVGIYTFIYAALGMLVPLLGQYLAHIGFTGVQIGIITSAATAIGIFASPYWGYRFHNSRDSAGIVLFLCIVSTLTAVGLLFVKQYALFLLGYGIFSFFQTPIIPLTDAMTLENRLPFGAVRKWGAIGFAAGVFLAGQLADNVSLAIIFPLCALGYTVTGIITARLRMGKAEISKTAERFEESPKKERKGNYRILIRNKKLMALLFAAFFICGTNVANNVYFGFLYKNVGGSIAGIGIALLLMCGGEAPFMAWTKRLENAISMERMILISMIISFLRYLWYSTGPAPALLIGTFFIQGMVNGIVLVELVRYIAKLVERSMIGMAMTLYQAISTSLSSILCQFASGVVLDFWGARQVYLFFAIYNAIGILLYIGFRLYKCSEKDS